MTLLDRAQKWYALKLSHDRYSAIVQTMERGTLEYTSAIEMGQKYFDALDVLEEGIKQQLGGKMLVLGDIVIYEHRESGYSKGFLEVGNVFLPLQSERKASSS